MRCSATTIAMPWRSRRSISVRISSSAAAGSSWLVGSSRSSTRGPIARTEAIATRWRSPPDSVRVVRSARCAGADHLERGARAGMDLAGRDAQVLEAEGGLGEHVAHDDLGLGILEHEPGVPRELARPVPARVEPGDAHAPAELAAVEVRHEAEGGPKEGRLAASRLADEEHELALVHGEVDARQRRPPGRDVAVAHALEGQGRHRATHANAAPSRASAAEPGDGRGRPRVVEQVEVAEVAGSRDEGGDDDRERAGPEARSGHAREP